MNEQGLAVFQNQIRIVGRQLYGLEYDITGSRLAALSIPSNVGRTPVINQKDEKWQYMLTTVEIDEVDPMYPKLTQVNHDLNDANLQSIASLYRGNSAASDNFVFLFFTEEIPQLLVTTLYYNTVIFCLLTKFKNRCTTKYGGCCEYHCRDLLLLPKKCKY